jgi:integrase
MKCIIVIKYLLKYIRKSSSCVAIAVPRCPPIDFQGMEEKEGRRLTRFFGEMARRERNISFHGFRHFFNSTIRGMVSDETLRLQTGHADAKTKILPYIPQDGMGD